MMGARIRILGWVSILIGIGIIVLTSRDTLFCLCALMGWITGDKELFSFDLGAIYFFTFYIFAPIGFIISGLGMFKLKRWAVTLFIILVILEGTFLLWLFNTGYLSAS